MHAGANTRVGSVIANERRKQRADVVVLDDISVLEFAATEYGRTGKVVASDEVKNDIRKIGINKCARESGFDRKNFIRKLVRGLPVKTKFLR